MSLPRPRHRALYSLDAASSRHPAVFIRPQMTGATVDPLLLPRCALLVANAGYNEESLRYAAARTSPIGKKRPKREARRGRRTRIAVLADT